MQVQSTDMRTQGEGDEWEVGTDVCSAVCITGSWGSLLCSTGSPVQFSVMTERGGMGTGEVPEGGHVCIHIADALTLYSRK